MGSFLSRLMTQQVQAEEGGDSFPAAGGEPEPGDLSRQNSGPVQRQNSWALRDAAVCKQQAITYSWGRGDLGQLGSGPADACLTPTKIEDLDGRDIVHAAGNLFNSAFLTGEPSSAVVRHSPIGVQC